MRCHRCRQDTLAYAGAYCHDCGRWSVARPLRDFHIESRNPGGQPIAAGAWKEHNDRWLAHEPRCWGCYYPLQARGSICRNNILDQPCTAVYAAKPSIRREARRFSDENGEEPPDSWWKWQAEVRLRRRYRGDVHRATLPQHILNDLGTGSRSATGRNSRPRPASNPQEEVRQRHRTREDAVDSPSLHGEVTGKHIFEHQSTGLEPCAARDGFYDSRELAIDETETSLGFRLVSRDLSAVVTNKRGERIDFTAEASTAADGRLYVSHYWSFLRHQFGSDAQRLWSLEWLLEREHSAIDEIASLLQAHYGTDTPTFLDTWSTDLSRFYIAIRGEIITLLSKLLFGVEGLRETLLEHNDTCLASIHAMGKRQATWIRTCGTELLMCRSMVYADDDEDDPLIGQFLDLFGRHTIAWKDLHGACLPLKASRANALHFLQWPVSVLEGSSGSEDEPMAAGAVGGEGVEEVGAVQGEGWGEPMDLAWW